MDGLKVMVVSSILAEYVRHGLTLNPELVGRALDAVDMVEAEVERRYEAAAEGKADAAAKAKPVVAPVPFGGLSVPADRAQTQLAVPK